MKKLVLTLMALLIANNCYADWLITVKNNTSSELTNYQVEVDVSDIVDDIGENFTIKDSSDTTLKYGFIQPNNEIGSSYTDSIWVKVPTIPASSDAVLTINESATNGTSDGDDIFIFYDDFNDDGVNFDATKWDSGGDSTIELGQNTVDLFTGSGTQGLAYDGTYFYHGYDNGDSVDGDIYKYDREGNLQDTFDAPPHAAGGDIREDHDTLLFSSGGTDSPEVWEINKETGTKIREWDFSGEGYDSGALVAYVAEDTIYLFTSDASYNVSLGKYTINDDGTWALIGDESLMSAVGIPQGLDYWNGYVRYLYDYNASYDRISALSISGTTASILYSRTYPHGSSVEAEGLAILDGVHYVGGLDHKISRIDQVLYTYTSSATNKEAYVVSDNTFSSPSTLLAHSKVINNYPMVLSMGDNTNNVPDVNNNQISLGKFSSLVNYLAGRNIKATSQTDVAYSSSINYQYSFNKYEAKWNSSGVEYLKNDTSLGTITTDVPTVDLHIILGGGTYGQSNVLEGFYDTSYLREYASTEPTVTVSEVGIRVYFGNATIGNGGVF